ncbi:Asp-tRNA(Asn)/Glu-tRNA(Gln) amidotransferase subunit GatA [SAR202 cluster bacterium AD-804-J14_MRT_500m]|nr:Asp-tRNA(Asn)/Glu-tRNA(Gln) amidotransferase subunit GatA [SAR202 cluster bacterium AD-804-J14_MRT_500m]
MMPANELCYMSADDLSVQISSGRVSPVEVVQAHLDRVEETEDVLNSFITRPGERALEAAKLAEKEIQSGNYRGPLHGIPVGLKDIYYVEGMPNTSGSKIYDGFMPTHDGAVAERFKDAGAILFGKLNMHQFAFGPTGLNRDYGDMHNPWDPDRITGGSSGGSGSAAAAGQCTITMGTDTGGSIRIPSALCGLSGIKPTYGRVSRYGLVPLSWSLDHPGPMGRTVEDCALALKVIAGHDPRDPASIDAPLSDYRAALTGDVRGLRIGVPKEYFEVPVDVEIKNAVERALDVLARLGAEVKEVSWPMYHHSAAMSTVILYAEAAAFHRDMVLKRGNEYDPSIRWRIEAGLFISGVDYIRAQRARAAFTYSTAQLLQDVDILAGPMEPMIAPKIGEEQLKIDGQEIGVIAALTQYTRPFNLTGFPALTVPCGFSNGHPIGLQLAARPFEETTALNAGYAYQQSTDWHTRRPPI